MCAWYAVKQFFFAAGRGGASELLSMAEVLRCLLASHQPLEERGVAEVWRSGRVRGQLVCHHHKVS